LSAAPVLMTWKRPTCAAAGSPPDCCCACCCCICGVWMLPGGEGMFSVSAPLPPPTASSCKAEAKRPSPEAGEPAGRWPGELHALPVPVATAEDNGVVLAAAAVGVGRMTGSSPRPRLLRVPEPRLALNAARLEGGTPSEEEEEEGLLEVDAEEGALLRGPFIGELFRSSSCRPSAADEPVSTREESGLAGRPEPDRRFALPEEAEGAMLPVLARAATGSTASLAEDMPRARVSFKPSRPRCCEDAAGAECNGVGAGPFAGDPTATGAGAASPPMAAR